MPRTIWKGAIAFGLVHIPVAVHAGARSARLDFDWIDKRDMAPVGYQRINKRTGKVIASEDIVKGYQYEKGEYVLLSDEDFRQANPEATQTIDIHAFVERAEIPIYYFDTPYYLEPDRGGAKVYALLRNALQKSGRLAVASVVLHTRQHLAAILPVEDALVMQTLRYANEILPISDLSLPEGKSGKTAPTAREVEMALRLVEEMTESWDPEQYHDTYREDLLARIEKKVQAGSTHTLAETETAASPRPSAKVIDLMSVLKQSLQDRPGRASRSKSADKAPARKPPARSAAKSLAKSAKSAKPGKSAKRAPASKSRASSGKRAA